MKLSTAAQLLNGKLLGQDTEFTHVATDTRKIQPGDLYIARIGKQLDGHDFLTTAQQQGAAAALVQYPVNCDLPQLLVADTTRALGQLATHHRQQFSIPIIGVTGSCGKTTVKTLLAAILQHCGPTLANPSSFNNEVGLPLTTLQLTPQHRYAVLEMGTNHFGEIAYLTAIAKPTVALITNAGPAHLEGLGDVAGVARAKGEIFQGLTADGIAIINADDPFAEYWQGLVANKTILRWSVTDQQADFRATHIEMGDNGKARFTLVTPSGGLSIQLTLLGRHNVANAVVAAAAAFAVNAPLSAIQLGLEQATPEQKRLNEHHTAAGAYIIDDTYNANPQSVAAAIDLLAQRPGETILILGDMGELGPHATDYHHQIGLHARQRGIHKLYTYGVLSQAATQAFGDMAQHFADQHQLITTITPQLTSQTTLLIKGSRSMHMEEVVNALVTKP